MKPRKVKELNIDDFLEDEQCVSIGTISKEMLDFIVSNKPDLSGKIQSQKDILFWKDRISHAELHKDDFMSDKEFENCMRDIPSIISNPDYISVHPTGKSISFIKDYSSHVSVAIKISFSGKMAFRTIYPVMSSQLDDYIDKGNAWRYAK